MLISDRLRSIREEKNLSQGLCCAPDYVTERSAVAFGQALRPEEQNISGWQT